MVSTSYVLLVFAPFEAILKNAGIDFVSNEGNDTYGYNVVTEEWCDMLEAGVIDPTKVTRTALEKAVSVASTLLTTECMVVNETENEGESNT